MTIQEKYIEIVKSILFPNKDNEKMFRDGQGYVFACPFCSDSQKRESKRKEKCAALTPLAGSFQWVFNCSRGVHNGKGTHQCSQSMRFDYFLKQWNPPLYRKYLREKGTPPPKMNYTPNFDR